ncbi:MAG: rhodanese-like domain-containing protein [Candidatus Neomarinimicrobiota bacterium]
MAKLKFYLIFLMFLASCKDQENISAQDASKYLDQEDVLFLDVRTFQEFNYDGSIKNALLIPVNSLEKKLTLLEPYRDKKIIVYCMSGRRSRLATDFLKKNNFKAMNLEGGYLAWGKYFSNQK